jgi:hypothetical protein
LLLAKDHLTHINRSRKRALRERTRG